MVNRLFKPEDNINEDYCVSIYDGSYDFYRAVLNSFVKEGKKLSSEMNEKYNAEDVEGYRIIVHGLKSLGGSVGAEEFRNICSESNELIKAGEWAKAQAMHPTVFKALNDLITLIETRLQN